MFNIFKKKSLDIDIDELKTNTEKLLDEAHRISVEKELASWGYEIKCLGDGLGIFKLKRVDSGNYLHLNKKQLSWFMCGYESCLKNNKKKGK